jgi:predicted AlkP superfamily phosphohydrolase/phosphomutase
MNRLLVIGLDGGTRSVTGLADAGLENLAALEREGASATLLSTVPPITAAAWASMFTGWNPGRHGMYDFRALTTNRYSRLWGAGHSAEFRDEPRFMTSKQWRGSAVWDIAGATRTVAISAVPMTYPAWGVNGTMVSGFPLPDYGRNHSQPAGYGDSFAPLLERADEMAEMSDEELAAHCQRLIDRQADVVRSWLSDTGPGLMVAVFQGTDFAQHRLWKYLDQLDHPLRQSLLGMYRSIDALIGESRKQLGADGTVAVVSDHGFGPHPQTLVHTDAVMQKAGLLSANASGGGPGSAAKRVLQRSPRLRRRLRLVLDRAPQRLSERFAASYTSTSLVDWQRTRAYRYSLYPPAEGVVINLRGRQEHGCVNPGAEYERARDLAIEALLELRAADGTPVVQWARRREDVYSGRYLQDAPDVVALFDPRFKATSGVGEIFSSPPPGLLDQFSGVHAMQGIFSIAGHGVMAGVDLGERDITDVAPTLLALMGIAPSEDIDGTAMSDCLIDAGVAGGLAVDEARSIGSDPVMTADEDATLERSLRALGYLD